MLLVKEGYSIKIFNIAREKQNRIFQPKNIYIQWEKF